MKKDSTNADSSSFPVYKNSSVVLETMWGVSHRAEEGFIYPVNLRKEKNLYWLFIAISFALVFAVMGNSMILQLYFETMGLLVSNITFTSTLVYITVIFLCVNEWINQNNLLTKYREDLKLLDQVFGHIPFGTKAYYEMTRDELLPILMDIFYFHVMKYQLDTSNKESTKRVNEVLDLLKRFGIVNHNSGVGEYTFLRCLNPNEDISVTITASHLEGSVCTLSEVLPREILEAVSNTYFTYGNVDTGVVLKFYEVTKPVKLPDVHTRGFGQNEGTVMYFTLCALKRILDLENGRYGKEFLIWCSSNRGTQYYTFTLIRKETGSRNGGVIIKPLWPLVVKKGVRVVVISRS